MSDDGDLRSALRDSQRGLLEPIRLKVPPEYVSNGTVGRVYTVYCGHAERRPQYLSQGLSSKEAYRRRMEERRRRNSIGLWALGPIAGSGGATVRNLGGREAAVESGAAVSAGMGLPHGVVRNKPGYYKP